MGKSWNTGQLTLDLGDRPVTGVRPQEARRKVLFFAVLPDAECRESAYRLSTDLRREHELSNKLRAPSLLHMTLCRVTEIPNQPEDTIALALEAGGRAGGSAFSMELDEVLSFKQPKDPIVLCAAEGNDAFRMLHIRLARALCNSSLDLEIDRSLRPHMTLLYRGRKIEKTKLPKPISLMATEFVLIRSHHGEGRHEYLGRWPLTEQQTGSETHLVDQAP